MLSFLERYRHLSLLVAMLLAQLFFLAFQVKTKNEVLLIRTWAAAAVSPVQKLLNWSVDGVGALAQDYVLLYGAQQENRKLKAELERTRIHLQELEARAAESDRLAVLLNLKRRYSSAPLVAAEVIGSSPTGAVRTIMLNRGKDAGFKPNMAVITPEGVIGKLVTVHPTTAVVLLLTDLKSGIGVAVADSRVHGVLKGNGTPICEMAYVPVEEELEPDTLLVTSGQDQVFPKGLPIGRIVSAERGNREQREFFWKVEVAPLARLTRLEHVFILAGPPDSLVATQSRRQAEAAPRIISDGAGGKQE